MFKDDYVVTYFGIVIPESDKNFMKVAKALSSKYDQVDKDFKDNEVFSYLDDLRYLVKKVNFLTRVNRLQKVDLTKRKEEFEEQAVLFLLGEHDEPSLIFSPFSSKENCIAYYRETFNDVLPHDFDYERYIATASFVDYEE